MRKNYFRSFIKSSRGMWHVGGWQSPPSEIKYKNNSWPKFYPAFSDELEIPIVIIERRTEGVPSPTGSIVVQGT